MTNLLEENPKSTTELDALSATELRSLFEAGHAQCVSIFMPTHRGGQERPQDPIRLKNLLDDAEEQLAANGGRRPEARALLQPIRDLLENPEFWQHQSEGLAIFIAEGEARAYRVPIALPEAVHVGTRFQFKPLLALLGGDGLFYVIAMSQKELRLLRCTRTAFEEVDHPDLPHGEEELLRFIEEDKSIQWHTGTPAAAGGGAQPSHGSGKGATGARPAVFHGSGEPERHYKDRIREYFRLVAAALGKIVRDQKTPIVFVGVDYLLPMFRDAVKELNVLPQHVPGNPQRMSSAELHKTVWRVVEPYFQQARGKAMELYQNAAGATPEKASADLAEVVRAACAGRIGILFVANQARACGRYDVKTGQVTIHQHDAREAAAASGAQHDDLLDLAATHTFIHDGLVYAVDRDEMPADADACAVMRF